MSKLSTAAEWSEFLKSFAAAIDAKHPPGNPGATEEVLQKAEAKLKITLPPSYRCFLSVSNGWRNASRAVPVLRPVEKIQWFKKEHPDWVAAYVDPMAGVDELLPSEKDYFHNRSG